MNKFVAIKEGDFSIVDFLGAGGVGVKVRVKDWDKVRVMVSVRVMVRVKDRVRVRDMVKVRIIVSIGV